MTNQLPVPEHANLPDDAIPLLPRDGLDGFEFFCFEVDGQLGLAVTIHTQTLGDFIVPITGSQAAALNVMFDRIAKLTEDDAAAMLTQLRNGRSA